MKKGRPGMILSALAEPSSEARLRRVFFETTTTFGVRSSLVRRAELERTVEAVDLPDGGRVRIKVGWLGGRVISATPEHDDVAAVARQAGLTVRQALLGGGRGGPLPAGNGSRTMTAAVEALERRVRSYQASRAVVAYSGGVDSATVVAVAVRALGPEAVEAVTAISPSYPAGELEAARAVAASIGVPHRTIATREVERDAYARNDALRCFHCKSELYGTLQRLVAAEGGPGRVVLAGANADDLADLRPGLRAAEQQGVRNPLLEEGLGKAGVRAVASRLGLTVADKPALACLSSRVAQGLRITPDLLARHRPC